MKDAFLVVDVSNGEIWPSTSDRSSITFPPLTHLQTSPRMEIYLTIETLLALRQVSGLWQVAYEIIVDSVSESEDVDVST